MLNTVSFRVYMENTLHFILSTHCVVL